MQVKQQTPELLVIEESASSRALIGGFCSIIGAVFPLIAWVNEKWLFAIVGAVFLFFGLKTLLFGRISKHRFERSRIDPSRGRVAITSHSLWKKEIRELPFGGIADIVIEETRGSRSGPSYYLHYITKEGERIAWGEYFEGSKEDVFDCSRVAREFVGFPAGDPPVYPWGKLPPVEQEK